MSEVQENLEKVRQLRDELLEAGVDVAYREGVVNDAEIRFMDDDDEEVTLFICLLRNSVVIQTETGYGYDNTIEQARNEVMSAYL